MSNDDTKALAPKRITKRNVAKYQERTLLNNIPTLANAFFPALERRMQAGDPQALKLCAEMMGFVKGSNPTVNVSVQQNNVNGSTGGRDRGFENIIRVLEARDSKPSSRISDSIEEAEFEEVK